MMENLPLIPGLLRMAGGRGEANSSSVLFVVLPLVDGLLSKLA